MSRYKLSMHKELERGWSLFNKGKLDEALQILDNFERKEDLTPEDNHYCRFLKGIILLYTGRFQESLKIAEQDYQESEKQNKPLFLIDSIYTKWNILFALGRVPETWEDVVLCEKLLKSVSEDPPTEVEMRIGFFYYMRGYFFFWEHNYDNALEYHRKSLSIFEKDDNPLVPSILCILGHSYANKGDLELALNYHVQSVEIFKSRFPNSTMVKWLIAGSYDSIGSIYYQQGNLDIALEYYEKSIEIWEQLNSPIYVCVVYYNLIRTLLAKNSPEQAKEYLHQFYQYNEKHKLLQNISYYKLSHALILKSSTRTRDRAEAEKELIKIIKWRDEVIKSGSPGVALEFSPAISTLCRLYLEELRITNDMTILNEIEPLIERLLKESERTNSYSLQAQARLLRGKIALLQMNMGDARRNLSQAQEIAESHNLHLLARMISHEHDKFLDQLDEWENLKKNRASISERMDFALLDESLELLQQKRAIKAPELPAEEPVLLLIIAGGGILLFSYPFSDKVKINEELFGGFLSAFNSFSDEILSEGLDRVKFGQYTVLIENIADFSFCYLFKGQTYLAKKKLLDFAENFKKNNSMMQTLEKSNQSSQVIELKDFPFLEGFIRGIFAYE